MIRQGGPPNRSKQKRPVIQAGPPSRFRAQAGPSPVQAGPPDYLCQQGPPTDEPDEPYEPSPEEIEAREEEEKRTAEKEAKMKQLAESYSPMLSFTYSKKVARHRMMKGGDPRKDYDKTSFVLKDNILTKSTYKTKSVFVHTSHCKKIALTEEQQKELLTIVKALQEKNVSNENNQHGNGDDDVDFKRSARRSLKNAPVFSFSACILDDEKDKGKDDSDQETVTYNDSVDELDQLFDQFSFE